MASIVHYSAVILPLMAEIWCNNVTVKYNTMDSKDFQSKNSRLLTFNTQDNGDISMELAFNVPFITIPVKKSIDMAQGAIANVNIGAIVLGGAMLFGFAVLIPGILALMSKKVWNSDVPNIPYYRREDSQQWWEYLNVVDQHLNENGIDTTSCMQRMICWAVRNSAQNVKIGRSSSSDKIIDGLATSKWVHQILEGTTIHSALQNGLGRIDCSRKYHQCKISEDSLQTLTRKFVENVGGLRN